MDGSAGFGAAGFGPVPGPPVSARAFGTPIALSARFLDALSSIVSRDCYAEEFCLPRDTCEAQVVSAEEKEAGTRSRARTRFPIPLQRQKPPQRRRRLPLMPTSTPTSCSTITRRCFSRPLIHPSPAISAASIAKGTTRIDIPEGSVAGLVNDMWQRPVIDIGQTGPGKGNGGSIFSSALGRR